MKDLFIWTLGYWNHLMKLGSGHNEFDSLLCFLFQIVLLSLMQNI
jgi:hypothetical protein